MMSCGLCACKSECKLLFDQNDSLSTLLRDTSSRSIDCSLFLTRTLTKYVLSERVSKLALPSMQVETNLPNKMQPPKSPNGRLSTERLYILFLISLLIDTLTAPKAS
jgi:hypothetical protein